MLSNLPYGAGIPRCRNAVPPGSAGAVLNDEVAPGVVPSIFLGIQHRLLMTGRHVLRVLKIAVIVHFSAASLLAVAQPAELSARYMADVVQRLQPPPDETARYGALALEALDKAGLSLSIPQYVVLVDRSPQVQALFVFWLPVGAPPLLVGASPVSTGRVGSFDHFETPLGVFDHTTTNPDFRAEGTKNELGFRGYGIKGMRVYDLGWQVAQRGWGKAGESSMRLQMHSTDPALAEAKLGSVQSKGCIRIPASLNRLLDITGLLDAAYEAADAAGPPLWVLAPDRVTVSHPGRYVVVVDTLRDARPSWSPLPTTPGEAVPTVR